MAERPWRQEAPPGHEDDHTEVLRATVSRSLDLTRARGRLADLLADGSASPADDADVERLLLACEELASNGLRHGGPPVEVAVTTTPHGWLIVVTDGDADRAPTPAVDRDPARGGLGLHLVARLSARFGWNVVAGRKHVWAFVRRAAGV